MTIQEIPASGWERVRDVRLRSLQESPEAFTSSYERESAWNKEDWAPRWNNRAWFLSSENNFDTGIAGTYAFGDPQHVHVIGMWVDPAYRGTKAAEDLIDACKAWTRNRGSDELALLVVPGNIPARRFYEKVGFTLKSDSVTIPEDPHGIYAEYACELL